MDSTTHNADSLHREVQKATELLNKLLSDRTLLNRLSENERKSLLISAGKLSRPERLEIMKLAKVHRRAKKRKIREADRALTSATLIRKNRTSSFYQAPPKLIDAGSDQAQAELQVARACYICKSPYYRLHFFYDALCPECAQLNYEKRYQTADLRGRYALITGARLKIGYQAALTLLRCGAHVVVTTRFPRDAAFRFAAEKDFASFDSRLQIFGLDLRHSPSVELFCKDLSTRLPRLDFLINNAAQTVRRPPGFYAHLMERESLPLSELPQNLQPLLSAYEALKLQLPSGERKGNWLTHWQSDLKGKGVGLSASAALSQVPYTVEDCETSEALFPVGKLDADLQQVDLRNINSWRLRLHEVSTPELLELQLVNAIAPFILCAKLKPLMLETQTGDKHVVNVSAMEGKFSRFTKTDKHPHTNMAKAALNMMTLTSAADFAKDGIYMNAVDTGWVTDEDPHQLSLRKQSEHDFQPPLDIVDGAARILDPILDGINTGRHTWGKFLKDYQPTAW